MTTKSHKLNPADKVEQWPIERLVPYARNARTHSDEQAIHAETGQPFAEVTNGDEITETHN